MSRLYVVGIGPGKPAGMTLEALEVLESCPVIAGYTVYVDLVKERFPDKRYLTTSMKQEVERCRMALMEAAAGQDTAMVCSGDAGVYGMAGLLMELGAEYPQVEIIVVPGVSAVLSGGAVLGAPVGHDFAVISLSDLLTPWEMIERRLRCASMADLVICLYNPSSRKRKDYLKKACRVVMEQQRPDTVCGYVKQIGRPGQEFGVLTLEELAEFEADMFTTVFIGSSRTKEIGGRMVTPRGYRLEERAR
ncbi:MAG: precorrin-3B C(17)-methyltransferase [Lachnospiraceae bacterium]|nr:precorrin-3B C(17)-methyltransferase [Lachnospiraceae bacterium]